MKFNDRYELIELLTSNHESATFRAVEIVTTQEVLVHVLAGPEIPRDLVPQLSSISVAKVLATDKHKGQTYIVTSVVPGVGSLREALRSPAAVSAKEPGDFTRNFGGKASDREAGSDQPAVKPADGEFTILFHGPGAPASPGPGRQEQRPEADFARGPSSH